MNLKNEAICFDDVLLVPQNSQINSRRDVDLSMSAGGLQLNFPVIASPMDTVCEYFMAITMADHGGLGIIHRHQPLESQMEMIQRVADFGHDPFGSIGINGDFLLDAKRLVHAGAKGLCIDVANGHSQRTIDAVRALRNEFDIHIMAGNVSTGEGFYDLADAGANSVRVGIGGGSMCTTRIVTGHGLPTLQSIIDVETTRTNHRINCAIIADGGIRNSGDMVKAFAAGADFVMVGSMLAGTKESPGDVINNQKVFRGMASKSAQEDSKGFVSVVEGAETRVPYKGSAVNIIKEMANGIRSGCSYSGVSRLSDLYIFAQFAKISANSVVENRPHGV